MELIAALQLGDVWALHPESRRPPQQSDSFRRFPEEVYWKRSLMIDQIFFYIYFQKAYKPVTIKTIIICNGAASKMLTWRKGRNVWADSHVDLHKVCLLLAKPKTWWNWLI